MQRSAWLALLLLLVSASSAVACLNDRETAVVEREFRSRYESPANPGAAGEIPQGNEHLSNLPIRDEWNIPIAVLGFLGFVFSIVAVIYTTPQVAPPSSRALVRRQRAIALCVVAIPTGCLLYGGLLVRGYIKLGGLRTQSITRPAAYELPKIPGGTSFRMAMLHDVLLERYLRHGQAWYEERNKESHAAIDEERAKPGPTTRMLDAMDDLAVGLENLHESDEAAAVMEDKLTLLPAEVVKQPIAPAPDLRCRS
jgi:hypothetical protein